MYSHKCIPRLQTERKNFKNRKFAHAWQLGHRIKFQNASILRKIENNSWL